MERLFSIFSLSKHAQIATGSPEPIWQLVRVAAEQLVHPQPAGGGGAQQASGLLHLPLQDVKAGQVGSQQILSICWRALFIILHLAELKNADKAEPNEQSQQKEGQILVVFKIVTS